jgi:hypothetical protein
MREREKRGDKLTAAQRAMWREALRDEAQGAA